MSGDLTKPLVGNTALAANYIQSLNTVGFTVGTDARVNSNGVIYHWVAFKAASGEMRVDSYTGTGTDNTLISGVGFNPSLIFIMSAGANAAVLRPNTSSNTFDFTNGAGFTGVGGQTSDGFYVRTDARVNDSGRVYHYVAWNNVAGLQKFNGHWGDNTDNRDVTGLGFRPYYLIIKDVSSNQDTVFHSGTMGFSTDATMYYKNSSNLDTNRIQALLADGYQVGNDSDTNKNTSDYYAVFAWGRSLPTAVNTGAAIYREGSVTTPRVRAWNGSFFEEENSTASVGVYRAIRGAGAWARDEKIVCGITSSSTVSTEIWNGSSWSSVNMGSPTVSENYWCGCDVTYEQQSGDAVMVWNDNSQSAGNKLRYSVWNGTFWTTPGSVAAYTGSEPQQIHIAPNPKSDEMVLVVSDPDGAKHALVWNGSSWGNAITLDSSGTGEADQTALYAAYERQSGQAMVVYGKNGNSNAYYRIWNGTSWGSEQGPISPPSGVTSQIQWITLGSDPTSNRIVLGALTTGGSSAKIWLNVWNGSAWGTSELATVGTSTATGSTYPNVAVAFEGQSGKAVAVYGNSGSNNVYYKTWTNTGGWTPAGGALGPSIGAVPNTMMLDSDPSSNRVMLSVQDADSELSYILWNDSSWGGPSLLEDTSGETKNQPFLFLWTQTPGIKGQVFEDINYGGGSGRSASASGGIGRPNARVELFDASGNFSTSTTTDTGGNYTFLGLAAGTYYVRVVTSSVTSSRTGYSTSCLPVMTYRTDASSGTATSVTNYVGGHDPATADAGNAASGWVLNSSTGAFSGSGSGKAHAFALVTASSSNITGVDFGFNFDTIVNTNNTGQGSLRQFITNANTLGGDASLAQSGLVATKENAVFMISNGTAAAGLRTSNNYFSGGVATISPTSALPTISTPIVIDAQKQPGWTSAPIVELNGTNASTNSGLKITGGGSTVRGFVINNFQYWYGIELNGSGGNIVAGNYLNLNAAGTAAAPLQMYSGIGIESSSNNTVGGVTAADRNVIGGISNQDGLRINGASSTGNVILGNYIGLNAAGTAAIPNSIGVGLYAPSNTIGGTVAGAGNIISGNDMYGIYISGSGNSVQGNMIGLAASGTAAIENQYGILIYSSSNMIGGTVAGAGNTVSGNRFQGVIVQGASATGNAVLGNAIYSNGSLGIDLGNNGVTVNDGAKTSGQPNLFMDYPVFTTATLNSNTLTVAGYVGSAAGQSTFANARVEIFKSDNDGSGYGEGKTYIGYLTTNASGNFSGSLTVQGGSFTQITGTATDTSNNTSEFGPNKPVAVTAVRLLNFLATGDGGRVQISWQTAQEADNKGFNLYRADAAGGAYVKLNSGLIPAASISGEGQSYRFTDANLIRNRLYYYKLEDVDVLGAVTVHGPVCVDWDADGMPDDWEIAHGLNPAVNDANLDPDGDGVPNWLEYQRGTDPFNWDSDGDGIPDGAEKKSPGYSGGSSGSVDLGESVQIISSDSTGMTLELLTRSFDTTPVQVGGQAFERLRVPAYVHGFTQEVGSPQLPVKGILLDVPADKTAELHVLSAERRVMPGYRVYPAPEHRLGNKGQLDEVFVWDEAAYRADALFPATVAELSTSYVYRGQTKQRLLFHPLQFNPAMGDLVYTERIRVRVDYTDGRRAVAASSSLPASATAENRYAAPSDATAYSIPAGTAYKVSVAGEGIYRITRAGLQAKGIADADIDAINLSQVQLFNLGQEQAIRVYDQNGDHVLDTSDFIEFYGSPVPAAYAKYARYNVYWLIDAGSASPLRMQTIEGAPAGGPLVDSHQSTVHHELEEIYLMSAVGADSLDRWIFGTIAVGAGFEGGGSAQSFSLSLPWAVATGDLRVRLYSPYAMEHETAVGVNGVEVGRARWSGIGYGEATFSGVSLLDGPNTVSITCDSGVDKTGVDWFEVLYDRAFAAVTDSLKFSHAGGYRYQVSQFTTNDVEVFDITDASAVSRVLNGTYTGTGPYTLEVEPAGASGTRTYLAVASSALKSPVAVVKDSSSSLTSTSNAADWILITHRDIGWDAGGAQQSWVTSLVNLRQSKGLRTAVVDVQDIFDEFGYGLPTPQAIKDFITYAYENWQAPAPQYVLLVGDTTYDYKDNWNLGTVNYVPGRLIYTKYLGETISDDWYVQVSGADAVPDLYIGRLPANSAAQAEDMVAKIVAYETTANAKLWEKRVILVADNQAENWESVFETMNEDAAALLPAGMATPERFYLQEYENESLTVSDLTTELKAAINAGALIVNYSGHGSVNILATEKILDNRGGGYRSDVTTLSNSGMYPFVVNMSCLTGYFIYPTSGSYAGSGWLSLAEGFILPSTKGAIATLMPTAMTGTTGQHVLSNALYEAIFSQDQRVLGDAVAYAKQQLLANGDYREESNTFLFFGDPATKLKVPLPRRPQGLSAQQQADGTVALSWSAGVDCDGHAVAGYNLYRRLSTEDSHTKLNTGLITELSFTDAGLTAAPVGSIYYYVLNSVDTASDESAKSVQAALTIADSGDNGGGSTGGGGGGTVVTGGGGGGGGCFIVSAGMDLSPDMAKPLGAMSLLICLVWISRRNRE